MKYVHVQRHRLATANLSSYSANFTKNFYVSVLSTKYFLTSNYFQLHSGYVRSLVLPMHFLFSQTLLHAVAYLEVTTNQGT